MTTAIHIYPLSKLVHALPGDWERALRTIEEGKERAFSYYLPLREAAVRYCKNGGKRYDELVEDLERRAQEVVAPRANPVKDNRIAFETFVAKFYPRITKFRKSLLRESSACAFASVKLLGLPHFIATDDRGNDRCVYLLAAKWDDEDLKAYLELLGVVIQKTLSQPPESLWCMDLRNGHDIKWRPSARIKTRCENAAQLYARFIKTMSSE